MLKRLLCLTVAALLLLAPVTACSDKEAEPKGNLAEIGEPLPGDIYAEIEFIGFNEKVLLKLLPDVAPIAVEQFTTRAERGFYDGRNIHRIIEEMFIQGGSINFDGTDGEVEEREYYAIEASEYARHFYGALALVPNQFSQNLCQFYIVTHKEPVDIEAAIAFLEDVLDDQDRPLNSQARSRHEKNLATLKAIPENVRQQYLTKGGVVELDGTATVFGQLVSGSEVIDAIAAIQVAAGNSIDDELNPPVKSKPIEEIVIRRVIITRIPLDEPEESTTRGRGQSTTTSPSDDGLSESINMDDPSLPPQLEYDSQTGEYTTPNSTYKGELTELKLFGLTREQTLPKLGGDFTYYQDKSHRDIYLSNIYLYGGEPGDEGVTVGFKGTNTDDTAISILIGKDSEPDYTLLGLSAGDTLKTADEKLMTYENAFYYGGLRWYINFDGTVFAVTIVSTDSTSIDSISMTILATDFLVTPPDNDPRESEIYWS